MPSAESPVIAPPASTTSQTPAAILDQLVTVTAQIDALTTLRKSLLDELSTLHDLGHLPSKLEHNGWGITWSAGRTVYDYPPEIIALEAELQAAKEATVVAGTAVQKPSTPFWSVRKPRPAKEEAA